MKYLLTEEEHKARIQINLHRKICHGYQKKIDALNSVIALTRIKIKLKDENEKDNLDLKDVNFLYGYIRNKAIDCIFSLAKKYKKEINAQKYGALNFTFDYDTDWAGIMQCELGSIDSQERTILDDNDNKIELITLTTESIINFAVYLEKYCKAA